MKIAVPPASADTLLMIKPSGFGYDPETAASNAFQIKTNEGQDVRTLAMAEFSAMVNSLRREGLRVIVLEPFDPAALNAVFPNNWFSTHADGRLIYYPMAATSRRTERSTRLAGLLSAEGLMVNEEVDLSYLESFGLALEGTGSLVFDRTEDLAFAGLSERTSMEAIERFEERTGIWCITFRTADRNGLPIYHTNVLMSIGEHVCIICSDVFIDPAEYEIVVQKVKSRGRVVITIDHGQLEAFCGNALEVRNDRGEHLLLMSSTAFKAFRPDQLQAIRQVLRVVDLPIPTIEQVGGGSVRCMLAEILLPRKTGA